MIEKRNISLNLNVRGLEHSPTLRVNQRVRELRAEGRTVHNLGLGQSPFPVPGPVVETLRLHASRKEYLPVHGLPELRDAIAEYHRKKDHVEARPEQVLVGPGSKELLFLLQLCFYGEIIVPTPCWVSYTPQAQILGRKVRFIPSTSEKGWKLDPADMVELFEADRDRYRPRLFVLNYPSNPTGVSYTADELQAVAKVAREYEVLILSDEIYSGLHHTGDHVSIARYYPEGTIIANGISKWCGAGGWRLGSMHFPPDLDWLSETMAAVASETYTSVSAPIQYAAVKAFEGGLTIETYLMHARRILRTLSAACTERLGTAGVDVVPADGAFYLFPDFVQHADRLKARGITTSDQLANVLLEEAGVAGLPGSDFNRDRRELTMRISLVDFDGAEALARSDGVPLDEPLPAEFMERSLGSTLEAMETVGRWLDAL